MAEWLNFGGMIKLSTNYIGIQFLMNLHAC